MLVDTQPVLDLKELFKEHPHWEKMLKGSLKLACAKAKRDLNPDEREHFKPYPDTLPKYFEFLNGLVTWIPTQDYAQEVFLHLCKFYWLIDQPSGRKLQTFPEFARWMRDFADDWGLFLDEPESLTQHSLRTFYQSPEYGMWQYVGYDKDWQEHGFIRHKAWLSFNQFFSREIKPGLRPVAGLTCDKIVTAPADCTFKEKFPIDNDNEVTIKHTHKYKILDLLAGSPYREEFRGGMFMHNFLGPNDYHRFHAPVKGTVLECRAIQQKVYLDVQIVDGQFTAPDGAGYEFTQTRGLIIFDSPIGMVAVLPIGMAQVSSVNMTAVEGAFLNKGDEFGYFQFGGSDIVLLFQKEAVARGLEITNAPGVHTNVGVCVAQII